MAKTKRKSRGLKWFNVLFSRACFLERPILNIYKHCGVYVTRYKGKILVSREAIHDKASDAFYDNFNISVEAMMPNITVKKKKSTRGKASTARYQERKKMEKKRKADQEACSIGVWDKDVHWVQLEKLHKLSEV